MSLRTRLVGEGVDRLLGDPARLDGPGLARGARRGTEPLAVRCVRELAERDDAQVVPFLLSLLEDERPAVRRAAVAGLGHRGASEALPALRVHRDGTEEGQLVLAVARVRCGGAPAEEREGLARFERRALPTYKGPREPQAATGMGGLTDRFEAALGGPIPRPRAELLDERRARLARGDRDDLEPLALLRHPADFGLLQSLLAAAGRREEHALFIALGASGDPRALDPLTSALFATDVDPGRGFAQRRLAATSLGRLGLRAATRALLRALENEALDFEGRPGAGMGVQYPVRTNLLWALGEVGDPAAIPTLAGYLANVHGSAFGGFYLPAMDALVKHGPAALPVVRGVVHQRDEVAAANAVGVLAALGEDVRPLRADPRRIVADVAARATGDAQGG